jgi:uncharacterized membrane protein YhaH (DUF805 family)
MSTPKMKLKECVNAVKDAISRFADFAGTSSISQFWYYILAVAISSGIVGVIAGDLGQNIFSLITLIPTIAVAVRRINDVGKSRWFLLVPVYNIVLLASPSKTLQ